MRPSRPSKMQHLPSRPSARRSSWPSPLRSAVVVSRSSPPGFCAIVRLTNLRDKTRALIGGEDVFGAVAIDRQGQGHWAPPSARRPMAGSRSYINTFDYAVSTREDDAEVAVTISVAEDNARRAHRIEGPLSRAPAIKAVQALDGRNQTALRPRSTDTPSNRRAAILYSKSTRPSEKTDRDNMPGSLRWSDATASHHACRHGISEDQVFIKLELLEGCCQPLRGNQKQINARGQGGPTGAGKKLRCRHDVVDGAAR